MRRNFKGSLARTLAQILGNLASRARFLGVKRTRSGLTFSLFEAELDGVLYRLWTEPGGALRLVRALAGKDEYESEFEFEWDEGISPNEIHSLLTLYIGEQLKARGFNRWSDKRLCGFRASAIFHSALKTIIFHPINSLRHFGEFNLSSH